MSAQPQSVVNIDQEHGLASRAMLVDLTVRQWNPRKTDSDATEELEREKGASGDAGSFIKNLVNSKAAVMRSMKQSISAMKKFHELRTSPWAERGVRILLAANHSEYDRVMKNEFIPAFDECADELGKSLEGPQGLYAVAKKELGGLFKKADYPTPEQVRDAYRIELKYRPLPVAGDWRVELNDVDLQRLRNATEDETKAVVMAATGDAFRRVAERVQAMLNKLKKVEKGESNRVFKSMIGNVREIAEALPALNIAGDPNLEQIGLELRAQLCTYDVKELKDDPGARKETMKAAESLLAKVSGYMGEMS